MFKITLSVREFDDEARAILQRCGGTFCAVDGLDGGFPLIRFTFPNIASFKHAITTIEHERNPF